MNSDESGSVMAICFLVIILLITTWLFSYRIGELKAKAVEVGAAEWIVDPTNGDTTFTWKEKK